MEKSMASTEVKFKGPSHYESLLAKHMGDALGIKYDLTCL
jgi:hypothetical protein